MGKVRKEDPSQKQINYGRAWELNILRHVNIPTVILKEKGRDRTIKPRDLLGILRVFDDHGQKCWPSIPTIAAEARMPRNSVLRAIKALEQIGWIHVAKRGKSNGGFVNQYSIVWAMLAIKMPPPKAPSPVGSTTVPSGIDHRPHVGTQSAQEAPKKRPPPAPQTKASDPWRKVEEEFRTHLGAVSKLVKRFKAEGRSPVELRSKLEEGLATVGMAANVGKFTSPSGAVFAWIESGVWPAADVISIEQERRRQEDVAVMNQHRIAKERADAERAAAFEAKLAALEAEHGAALDAMSGREQAALLDNQLATALIKRGKAKAVRPQLLEALAGRTASVG